MAMRITWHSNLPAQKHYAYGRDYSQEGTAGPGDLWAVPAPQQCAGCGQPMTWVDCPTGGWWSHDVHPDDGHDAYPACGFACGRDCPRCHGCRARL